MAMGALVLSAQGSGNAPRPQERKEPKKHGPSRSVGNPDRTPEVLGFAALLAVRPGPIGRSSGARISLIQVISRRSRPK
jgi:hypothetical protein